MQGKKSKTFLPGSPGMISGPKFPLRSWPNLFWRELICSFRFKVAVRENCCFFKKHLMLLNLSNLCSPKIYHIFRENADFHKNNKSQANYCWSDLSNAVVCFNAWNVKKNKLHGSEKFLLKKLEIPELFFHDWTLKFPIF